MEKELISYIDFLCRRYNRLSEAKAFNEAGAVIEYGCKISEDELSEISSTIADLCDIVGVLMPERVRVTKHKVLHDEVFNVEFRVFNAQI